jgi:predicted 3-demethylubiquinone-9 3-methyltransferase (glyoxalase superfamily)
VGWHNLVYKILLLETTRFYCYNKTMQKITPHLWFDTQAKEAAEFYTTVFPDSRVTHVSTIHDTPSGDSDIVSFELAGYAFMAISAGPIFKLNPSISFILNFDPSRDPKATEHITETWEKLSAGGEILMPFQEYPFSKLYGWVQDKYGVSWQLILTNPDGEERPFIMPSMMFIGTNSGKAEEAINFYLSIFKDSKLGALHHYGEGQAPNKPADVMFADFMLENQWFAAMDSGQMHQFAFNEATSLMVSCNDQAEIDYYWEKLSAVPESEQCGWLKDKYGVSWQIVPSAMGEMLSNGTPEQSKRVTEAFLKMKKFDLAELQKAYEG